MTEDKEACYMNDRPNGRREERGAHSRQERMQSRPAERSERSRRNGKHKNGKVLYYGVLVLLLAVLVFSSVKIISYMMEKKQSERTQQDLIDQVVTPGPDNDDTDNPGTEDKTPAGSEPDYITVDFKALQAKYPDVVGWLYCANTGLNYELGGGELGLPELQPAEGVKNTYYHGFTAQELDDIVRGNGCTVLYIQTLDDIFVQSYADLFTDKLAAAQSGETLLYRVTDAGFAPMQMEVSAR